MNEVINKKKRGLRMELWRPDALKAHIERIKCPRNEGRREWPSEPDAPEKSNKIELD